MKKTENINYKNNNCQQNILNIYIPDNNDFDLFIFFHGGGLTDNDISQIDTSVPYFMEKNIAIISPTYRVYPNAKYPDFIEDAAEAVKWSLDHINEYGNCKRVFIGGSSAGAYIAMMLCFDKRYLKKHNLHPSDFDGFIFDAGQPTMHFNVLVEKGMDSRRVIINETAPLYHVDASGNYPPMLFFVSDNDMECRYEQTMLTISVLKNFGYVYPQVKLKIMENSTHCQYIRDEIRNAEYTKEIGDFIDDIKERD